jgi:alpha-beta hydrolase superfamily lysophospholipase
MSAPPGPITPTRTTTIPVKGGTLHAEVFSPTTTARGVVLVTHGYAEHCGRYRELANVIVAAGWTALTYDVRGHGLSFGPRGFVEHFASYLGDLDAACAAARALADSPLVLLGHSHGSLITLRALCDERPPEAAGAILSSPFLALRLQVPTYRKLLARVASRVAPRLTQHNALRAEDLTHDVGKQQERIADKLCFDVATARWFTEASAAQRYVREHAHGIAVPTTWLVGGDDPIADPAESRRVAASVRGAEYHDLAGMRHEVFNELERARVFSEVTRALAAYGSAARS